MARNLATNPTCDNNVTGWMDQAPTRVTGLSGPPRTTGAQLSVGAGAFAASMAIGSAADTVAGANWNVVVWVRFSVTRTFTVYLSVYNTTTFVNTSTAGVNQSFTANTWTQVQFSDVTPAGTFNTVCTHFDFPTAGTAGTLTASSCRMDKASAATLTYADGATAGWVWDGTAGNSTSQDVPATSGLFLPF